jgi:D-sedoheptulose 7-phosphate isomerase
LHPSDYTCRYLEEVRSIAGALDVSAIDRIIALLIEIREEGGRLFFLGVGGGAAQASHAAGDFRKIAGMECYAPSDNVAELTARINDDGWDSCYANWLRASRIGPRDGIFVFSVGGGNRLHGISTNLVAALDVARAAGSRILGVVGRDGGSTAQLAGACVIVPTAAADTVTPHTEEFQTVVAHLLVTHPLLRRNEMKWESAK